MKQKNQKTCPYEIVQWPCKPLWPILKIEIRQLHVQALFQLKTITELLVKAIECKAAVTYLRPYIVLNALQIKIREERLLTKTSVNLTSLPIQLKNHLELI